MDITIANNIDELRHYIDIVETLARASNDSAHHRNHDEEVLIYDAEILSNLLNEKIQNLKSEFAELEENLLDIKCCKDKQ